MSQHSDLLLQGVPNERQRRLFVIVWMFVALVSGLFIFASVSINLLSAGRAYVEGEGLWSKGQKDAIYALSRYTLYGDASDFQNYQSALSVNLGDKRARLEMEKPGMNREVAYAGLLAGRNHPDDIEGMIFLLRNFRWVPDIDRAVAIWTEADRNIEALIEVGTRIHTATGVGALTTEQVRRFLTELNDINARLTPLEDDFSHTLGHAARSMAFLIVLMMFVVVAALLLGVYLLSRRLVLENEAAQDALRQGAAQLRNILQYAPLPIFITRFADETVVYANDHGLAQFKVSRMELEKIRPRDFYVNSADRDRFKEALQTTGHVHDLELQLKDADGAPFWAQYSAQRIDFGGHDCVMTALINTDQKKRVHDDLRHRAYHDELTGLPNRAMFMDALKRAIARIERQHGNFAVLFMDLDHFKAVNDRLGHDNGDLLLQEVARRLKACVRESDLVARLGGDEFVVLIEEHHQDSDDVQRVAEKILIALAQGYNLDGQAAHVTASIGISRFPQDGTQLTSLMTSADLAMYQAKIAGRNNLQFYRTGT